MYGRRKRREEFSVSGDGVSWALRSLFRGLLSRRVTLKTRGGRTLLPVPLVVAAPAVLLAPLWILLAAVAALAVGLRIVLEGPPRPTPAVVSPEMKAAAN